MISKRIISIMLLVTFSVMLVVAVRMKLFDNFIPGGAQDTADEAGTAAVQPPVNQGTNPYSKGDKVLDDTYLREMNEDVYMKSCYGVDINIRVTDSFKTRDVTEYYNLIPDEIEFLDIMQDHMDSNGAFIDDYYFLVTHVTITNMGTEKGEYLIPGEFTYIYLKDGIAPSSSSGLEIRYAAKMAGKGNASLKGHLIAEAGESYSFAMIGIVSEKILNKYAGQEKECYLGIGTASTHMIPKDGDKVRFIKLDLTER